MSHKARVCAVAAGLFLGLSGASQAVQLLNNGGFEAGYAFWSPNVLAGSNGGLFIDGGVVSPLSGYATAGPAGGVAYSITDQNGPGTYSLTQSFTVPLGATLVNLGFLMFSNDQSGAGPIVDPIGLDHTGGANQHVRVDLLTAAATPFDTGAGVVANLYIGVDPGASPHPWQPYSFNITGLVTPGLTYQIRFAEVDNQLFLQQGVDDVSITATVPEPGKLALMLIGLGTVGVASRSLRQSRHR